MGVHSEGIVKKDIDMIRKDIPNQLILMKVALMSIIGITQKVKEVREESQGQFLYRP